MAPSHRAVHRDRFSFAPGGRLSSGSGGKQSCERTSMSLRRVFLSRASAALGLVLVELLIRLGKINLRVTLLQLQNVSQVAFAKLVLLNGLLVCLSTQKWRSIDAALRRASDSVPSRTASFALTSAG